MEKQYKRGSIYLARLWAAEHSEQSGIRPVLIVSNDKGNEAGPTVTVAAITAKQDKPNLPTHVGVSTECGLHRDSVILMEQIRTLDKHRLGRCIGQLAESKMSEADTALRVSFALAE